MKWDLLDEVSVTRRVRINEDGDGVLGLVEGCFHTWSCD